jgi:zinc D-Ala-D-Ala carboxypeptidase
LRLAAAAAVATAGTLAPAPTAPSILLVDDTATATAAPVAPIAPDGSRPDGQIVTPFDTQFATIGRLDPGLLTALQHAAAAASADGVAITVNSGWRSRDFQQRLFDDAVATYGSVETARQYVAAPEVSRHVTGQAVDVGGPGADQWLIANGRRFGLCQIYANELWHFELADAAGNCPPLRPNAAS